jgi:hypothetical protein
MRWVIVALTGLVFMGCNQPVDISSAYWANQGGKVKKHFTDWPDWQNVPHKGVHIGKNESWADEYAAFVWDESGIYGKVFAFSFPAIALHPEREAIPEFPPHLLLMATTPNHAFRSHGKVKAFRFKKDKYIAASSLDFKTKDGGCVMKPGQCVTEFWISWDVLNPAGSPVKTSIRVKDRKLILDPMSDGDNVKK